MEVRLANGLVLPVARGRRAEVAAGLLARLSIELEKQPLGGTFTQSLASAGTGQFGGQVLGVGAPGIFTPATPTASALSAGMGPFGALNPAVYGSQLGTVTTAVPSGIGAASSAAAIAGPAASGTG
jgi:hypothetical protein